MKRYILRTAILAVAALMTLSCGKLLNIEQHGVENAEQYYSTDEEILTASADLYLKMRNLESNAITLKPLLDGDFWAGGGQHGDNSNLDKLAEYAFDAEDGTITGYFKGLYCFIFWLFGLLLLLLSSYLLPGSILAMVATSVPGIYPMAAINATTDLIQGRRTRFIIRLVFLVLFIAVIWIIVMLPLTYLDLILKDNILAGSDLPIIPFALQVMTTFSVVYATAYIYLLYRRMLDDPTN